MYSLMPNYQTPVYSISQRSLDYIVESAQQPATYSSQVSTSEIMPRYELSSFLPPLPVTYQNAPSSPYHQQEPLYHFLMPHLEYHFSPDDFLKPGREGIFVGQAEQIRPYIEQAFEHIFHTPFPADIKVSICAEQQFRAIAPSPNTIGISFNRKKLGLVSEIFVLNDSLARVMLTLGHEIGHVLTETMDSNHDEEAKAYAFSLAWIKIIKEQDIAGLSDALILENPAQNGLHNIAFQFIEKLLIGGENPWEIYLKLLRGEIAIPIISN